MIRLRSWFGLQARDNMVSICMLLLCLSLMLHLVTVITAIELIKDSETIVSRNETFKLGFFSPSNSKHWYLGIWYNNVADINFVWVANRNNPLNDSSGSLRLSEDGNLQVLNGENFIIWSSNVSPTMPNTSRTAKLLDTGNLCLLESKEKGTVIWQTFDHPTDAILPSMHVKMTKSNMKKAFQSWKSPSDPSYGRFSLGIDSLTHPQAVIWDGDRPHWRSGPWNGNIFLGLTYTGISNDYANTKIQQSGEDEAILVYTGISKLAFAYLTFSYDGSLNEIWWDSGKRAWQTVFRALDNMCDFYGKCGEFSLCNPLKSPICQCLRGFTPKNGEEWRSGNWSSGCVREIPLQCGTGGDGFLVLNRVKIPDLIEWLAGFSEVDCRSQCLENCSCIAYAYDLGAGCMYWNRGLIDIKELPTDGLDLNVRLPVSELGNKYKPKGVIIAAAVILGAIFIAVFVWCFWRCKAWRKGKQHEEVIMSGSSERGDAITQGHGHGSELPLLKFKDLEAATNKFHESHKLGQGGFGQVYKGRMKDGQEIAVKRLSRTSHQGSQEFMNEVMVISKLQHRNLVRLVGFCTEGDEKMLVYEYMPNKSLDAFLFDPVKRQLLDWGIRYNIIEGICRGLIYLHRDSRLRIIHRDLKASNILLDADLIPKISDFGVARIFSHNQDHDETIRVSGTYGYMSPEYAMEGHFSEKSDVFSFGVLVLEIVTGFKNNSVVVKDDSLTLLGLVWKSWVENNVASIIDPIIANPGSGNDIERFIQVGLLCVQEYAKDRPSIATVLSMLSSEITDLPRPKEPGFSKRLTPACDSSTATFSGAPNISITNMSAR